MSKRQALLSERLQLVLQEMGWRPIDLARASGASAQAVNNWLKGRNKNMEPEYAYRLEDRYHWNARWLLEGEGERRVIPLSPKEQQYLAKLRSLPEDRRAALDVILESL